MFVIKKKPGATKFVLPQHNIFSKSYNNAVPVCTEGMKESQKKTNVQIIKKKDTKLTIKQNKFYMLLPAYTFFLFMSQVVQFL